MTPRLHWAAELFFTETLGLEFIWTGDWDEFLQSGLPKINYSASHSAQHLCCLPHPILFETTIVEQKIEVGEWRGLPIFFENNPSAEPPFDFIAASFWLASRYEEHLPFHKDRHGRFPSTESLAHRHGFLQRPLIDLWAVEVGKVLKEKHPEIELSQRRFRFNLTVDIDHAFAFLHKGMLRGGGGLMRDFVKFDWKKCWLRASVILGFQRDPFDTYDLLKSVAERHGAEPGYFVHVGNYTGEPDAPTGFEEPAFRDLIQKLTANSAVGIHPSYRSAGKTEVVAEEIGRLSEITGRPVSASRQHFLLLEFPNTYRILLENGVSEDWTLGYADNLGFRASTARGFFWFDLLANEKTALRLRPFQIMDATLRGYLGLSPDEAVSASTKIIEEVRAVGGELTVVWHNSSLSEMGEWRGWRGVFERLVEAARG